MKKQTKGVLHKIRKQIELALLSFPKLNYYVKEKFDKSDKFELAIALFVKKLIKENRTPFFVQIGANNGIYNDPLNKFIVKYGLNGILVEPVPHLYNQLLKTYSTQTGLFFENVAIGDPNAHLTFYRVKSEKHTYYDQLGSFNKETILKHKKNIPNLESLIVEEPVQVVEFNTLMEKYNRENVDLLIMDTEGYDSEIIKMINFNKISFGLVMFESKHLSNQAHQLCLDLFQSHGFKCTVNESDTLCIRGDNAEIIKFIDGLKSQQ